MIKLKPYYLLDKAEQIEALYLNLAADVLPFLPEDVLDGVQKSKDSKSDTPRVRNEPYKKLLLDCQLPPEEEDRRKRRVIDACMAKKLIVENSKDLFDWLYEGCQAAPDGRVNRVHMRELLTTREPEAFTKYTCGTEKGAKLLLKQVFRYESFIKSPMLYNLIQMLQVPVCPYCNRSFTTTVYKEKAAKKASGQAGSQNQEPEATKSRPQLDHFKNKDKYPHLALSILNLVPCCGSCNLIKHDKDEDILYPYVEGMEDKLTFRTEYRRLVPAATGTQTTLEDFSIILELNSLMDKALLDRIRHSIDVFGLEELYQSHKSYVAWLYFQRYVLTQDMARDIARQFPTLFSSAEQVREIMLLMDPSMEQWGERPLAKLTSDISRQIDREYVQNPEIVRRIWRSDPSLAGKLG